MDCIHIKPQTQPYSDIRNIRHEPRPPVKVLSGRDDSPMARVALAAILIGLFCTPVHANDLARPAWPTEPPVVGLETGLPTEFGRLAQAEPASPAIFDMGPAGNVTAVPLPPGGVGAVTTVAAFLAARLVRKAYRRRRR